MQNEGGGSCVQSMSPEAGEVEIPQKASEQVENVICKVRARGDRKRSDVEINKTNGDVEAL